MKTTITLTREDGAEISFALPSVSQSFTLSFPRGMALKDAARDVVHQSMKAEAERVAALFNGAPATLSALEQVAEMTCENTGRNFDEWGEAACFTDCVRIASECLASVKGRT